MLIGKDSANQRCPSPLPSPVWEIPAKHPLDSIVSRLLSLANSSKESTFQFASSSGIARGDGSVCCPQESRTPQSRESDSRRSRIIQLSGDTAFFCTGNLAGVTDTRTDKVQYALARKAYDAVGTQPVTLPGLKDVANEWSHYARRVMASMLAMVADAKNRIGLAGFANLDENYRPKLIIVNIPISVPNDGSTASTRTATISECETTLPEQAGIPQAGSPRIFASDNGPRSLAILEQTRPRHRGHQWMPSSLTPE